MPADAGFRDLVLEKLASLEGVTGRSMFGGFGIFAGGDMFALISGAALFLKVDDTNRDLYEAAGSQKYGPMPYYLVPDEVFEDDAQLLKWAGVSVAIAHATTKKKPAR
jgi:DNA transformation protein and related proteins